MKDSKVKNKLKIKYLEFIKNNNNIIDISNSINFIKNLCLKRNFDENIDIYINIDKKYIFNKNLLNGFILLKNEIICRKLKTCLLAYGNDLKLAESYNFFDYIGMDNVINDFINKKIFIDIIFSTTSAFDMIKNIIIKKCIGKINIPSFKTKTLININNIENLLNSIKNKIVLYKINNNVLYTNIGKISQSNIMLIDNFNFIINFINNNIIIKNKKNNFLNKIFISTTMGPSLCINKL
ncbi:hypothetical protein [Candidatus Nardonella dryophthoridicola]|uniref:Large ribosomal subunit protein uL1 n=1 Tax=endosymbiont of Rhynchophorus ferrugineus TaxID=1972133 RepID=A0A2Z5TIK2_9GAMM|nr:hypothetical protein [Candidatus Nardonella dryophthoridicola]BBA85082.1 50S ribosomal protein L1 [endosymbiont of Rhynchophorus ferrugineus]